MKNHTRLSTGYLLKTLRMVISLVFATSLSAPILLAQEAPTNSIEVQSRGSESNAKGMSSRQHQGVPQGQKYPPGFVANSRVLGPNDIEQKWNRYLRDPRWRALEKEARRRGYQRAKGAKRLWGYEADVINSDGTTARIQMSVFDLERGNDGAALIWLQTNEGAKVLFLEIPQGASIEDASEWTADSAGNIGRLGSVGEVRTRSVSSYLKCMQGGAQYRDGLYEASVKGLQLMLLTSSAVGCAVGASVFGPFSFAVFLPCMLANAGYIAFFPAHAFCERYW